MENILDGFRLSPQQERLWLLRQQHGGAAFVSRCDLLVEGPLSADALRQSLARVVARHEILRTVFPRRPGIRLPLQCALEAAAPVWEEFDVSARDADAQASFMEENERRADATPFDLERGPVCRATLARLDAERHVLRLALPSLCADAASLKNIARELAEGYDARDSHGELDEECVQYVQFAEWQNELADGADDEQGREFWRATNEAASRSGAKLFAEREPVADSTFEPRSLSVELDAATCAALERAAAAHETTPELFLFACWQTLLCRMTGREEIFVGRECDGRKFEELTEACGPFAKLLPAHARVERGESFAEVLRRVTAADAEALSWQEYFIPADSDGVYAERDAAPAYAFGYDERPAPARSGNLTFTLTNLRSAFERTRLRLVCVSDGARVRAEFRYDAESFDAADVARLARSFAALVGDLASDPSRAVGDAEVLCEEDRRQLLFEFNQTAGEYPRELLHQLFEARAAETPDAIALVFEGRQLTYAQLNARANRLAHELRRRGVVRGASVALCFERSLEMVAALLGILKAGGAYVPLDPEQPRARLAHQLADCGASVLVTQSSLATRLPEFEGETIVLDATVAEEFDVNDVDAHNPAPVNAHEDIAYVIYTSGSTGVPKGVAVTHRGILNYTTFITRRLGVEGGGSPLHFATVSTISADLGNTAIFPALASGGCLHVVGYSTATDGARFAEYTAANSIDVLKIVPSHLSALLAASEGADILPRRFLITGGEALTPELVARVERAGAACEIINHYGPTETTVGSLTCTPAAEPSGAHRAATTIPVGRPIANTEAFVVDAALRPVPVGVAGELLIGGAGLARGYLNRPGQTAEKFVPNPFSNEPGARLYRTGDLARRLPDGCVEFLGRVDHQVKIRGFRVEPGEIEARLAEHADVRACVVVARADEHGHKRLVAYVVARRDHAPATADLRAFLQQRVAEYMIPSAFVFLKSLPLTANGKVDRAQLPDPAETPAELARGHVEPRTPVEEMLADIWRQVLNTARVSVHDNFFELGGDSILSLQIIARARQAGLKLTPKQLFDAPTVAELARAAEPGAETRAEQGAVTGGAPLTPIQRWFFENDFADAYHWNMSLALDARRALDPALLEAALRELLLHHDALRLRFTRGAGGEWTQVIAQPSNESPLEVVSLADLKADEREDAFLREAERLQAGLDLGAGPLVRAAWFDFGPEGRGRLLIVVHHLCVDGVSWRVLAEDLQQAYEQLERGEQVRLAAKSTSWLEWCVRQAARASSDELAADAGAWLAVAANGVRPLPRDFDATNEQNDTATDEQNAVADAESVSLALSEDETRALLRDVPAAFRARIDEALLSALARALSNWTGHGVALVDVEGHGREHASDDVDVSRTVGWFTTHYPVALDAGGAQGTESLLRRVSAQLARVPSDGAGYGLLRYSKGDAELARAFAEAPRPEVSFNYLGQVTEARVAGESLFELSHAPSGAQRSPRGSRTHLLQVLARVVGGRMELSVTYGSRLHRRETIEALAADLAQTLRALGAAARAAGGSRAADFAESRLTAQELERVLAQIDADAATRPGGGAENVEDIYALSPMQEGMLFDSLSAPESDTYFRQISFELRGELRVELFERAWAEVVARHAALRTSFLAEHTLQVVHRRVRLPLETHDWRGLAADEREERFASLVASERARGLDISVAPLMRLVLVRFDEHEYRLIWSYHHLVLEAWSRVLLYREVVNGYRALAAGAEHAAKPAPSYREYIAWLRRQDESSAEAFWRGLLEGYEAPTPLSLDEGVAASNGAALASEVCERLLPAAVTSALQTFARGHRLTLNTLVQGAWALLLSRYSGDEDQVFGMVVSGRPAEIEGVEAIVGLFINTLPLRVRVEPSARVLEWLRGLQVLQAEARQFEYSPLVRVHGWSGVPRGLPLFETVVNFGNFPAASDALSLSDGVEIRAAQFFERGGFPLGLEVTPGAEMTLRALYDPRRFNAENIETLLRRLGEVMEWFAADATRALGELTLQAERRPPVEEWAQPDAPGDAEAEFVF